MRILSTLIGLLLLSWVHAQLPPKIEWQESLGGSGTDGAMDIQPTSDGGYILAGYTDSKNVNVKGLHGKSDVWILKIDGQGKIQWQKDFGGSEEDYANKIIQLNDGGYVFIGETQSKDGDVKGNHGDLDVWIVRIDGQGKLIWQKCLGGSQNEYGNAVRQTKDGGFIFSAAAYSNDGDVTGFHGTNKFDDVWIGKLDAAGALLWERSYGSSGNEGLAEILETPDGGYIFSASTGAPDGDISCAGSVDRTIWLVKLDEIGNIQWQRCYDAGLENGSGPMIITTDGHLMIAGGSAARISQGGHGSFDIWIMKMDLSGNIQWQKFLGGSSVDLPACIRQTNDGGYIVEGSTWSTDLQVCNNDSLFGNLWLVKLDPSGNIQWEKGYGGSDADNGYGLVTTPDGGYIAACSTESSNGDVKQNNGARDIWMVKFSFPGVPEVPAISITTSDSIICPGENVQFFATSTNAGNAPVYEWKINGTNTSVNGDTVAFSNLNDKDQVNCVLISNSGCVSVLTDTSNLITVKVSDALRPFDFLPKDTSLCNLSSVEIHALKNYSHYLWSDSSTAPGITISHAGTYWLQVTDDHDCQATDTLVVHGKDCPLGLYVPSAFSPNGDGRNDVLRPLVFRNIKAYEFIVYDRAGEIIFRSSDAGKGWDGTFHNRKLASQVLVWFCRFQFEGEAVRTERGTITLLR